MSSVMPVVLYVPLQNHDVSMEMNMCEIFCYEQH